MTRALLFIRNPEVDISMGTGTGPAGMLSAQCPPSSSSGQSGLLRRRRRRHERGIQARPRPPYQCRYMKHTQVRVSSRPSQVKSSLSTPDSLLSTHSSGSGSGSHPHILTYIPATAHHDDLPHLHSLSTPPAPLCSLLPAPSPCLSARPSVRPSVTPRPNPTIQQSNVRTNSMPKPAQAPHATNPGPTPHQ